MLDNYYREQKAEKEPRMGKSLLILFSFKFPVTHSFISKLRPHSSKKESKRMQGPPALWMCVSVWKGQVSLKNLQDPWPPSE